MSCPVGTAALETFLLRSETRSWGGGGGGGGGEGGGGSVCSFRFEVEAVFGSYYCLQSATTCDCCYHYFADCCWYCDIDRR